MQVPSASSWLNILEYRHFQDGGADGEAGNVVSAASDMSGDIEIADEIVDVGEDIVLTGDCDGEATSGCDCDDDADPFKDEK